MLQLRTLSPALQKIATKELDESENHIKTSIEALREWLSMQPHLNARTDEQFLINVLRGCKYSVEKCKQKLEIYYSIRTQVPQYFKNRDISSPRTEELLRTGLIVTLPETDGEDGTRILLIRAGCYDPSKYTIQELMSAFTLISDETQLTDDNLCVAGYTVVLDVTGASMSHIIQYDPMFMKQMSTYFQDGCAGRFKGAYIVNLPSGLETFINFVKTFVNEKNRKKLHILGSGIDRLYEHIPQRLLPAEYGGEVGTIDEIMSGSLKRIRNNENILKAEETYGVDEKKRSSESKNADGLFGTMGTFRTLNLD